MCVCMYVYMWVILRDEYLGVELGGIELVRLGLIQVPERNLDARLPFRTVRSVIIQHQGCMCVSVPVRSPWRR